MQDCTSGNPRLVVIYMVNPSELITRCIAGNSTVIIAKAEIISVNTENKLVFFHFSKKENITTVMMRDTIMFVK